MSYAITQRLGNTLTQLEQEFGVHYCDRDYRQVLRSMKRSRDGYWDQHLSVLLGMLEKSGLSCEPGERFDTAHYERAIDALVARKLIPTKEEMGDQLLSICGKLSQEYVKYPAPSAYMERLVNRLSMDDAWRNDPLRLRILKQFIKYGNYGLPMLSEGSAKLKIRRHIGERIGKKSASQKEVLAYLDELDDTVFERIGNCGLLNLCQSLASGVFRTNGAAKRDLYLFAFAYNMTYFSHTQASAVYAEEQDITKNLFQDYYATNLMQYITQTYRDNPTASALDPSDCAINYRNYAEVVCLYYLCQDLTPAEKIRRAYDKIRELTVRNLDGQAGPAAAPRQQPGTIMMRNTIYGTETAAGSADVQDVMALSEEEFTAFMLDHFDARSRCTGGSGSPFAANPFGHTAAEEFNCMVDSLEANGELDENPYGLFFDDVRRPGENPVQADPYQMIMNWVDERLRDYLSFRGKPTVGRTTLLAAYYYTFNAASAVPAGEDDELLTCSPRSFPDHYEAFRRGADALFARVGFAPFSHKNLLDLMIVVSSYLYINS